MSFSGRQTIDGPYLTGFWFVAAQRGASDYQIAEATGTAPRIVTASNKDLSQVLAFPLSGPKAGPVDGMTLLDVRELWHRWQAHNGSLVLLTGMGLHSFRELVDPWLKHDHGRWEK